MAVPIIFAILLGCSSKGGNAFGDSADGHHDDHSDHEDGNSDLPEDFDESRTILSNDGLFIATYLPLPDPIPESTEFSVLITISDPNDEAVILTDAVVTNADSTMPSHGGHGMNVTPVVTDNGDGTWTASPLKHHMPGYWVLHVEAEFNGVSDRADFDISCCE